jgi:diacylglycerol kinase family enzyme
VRLQLIVNPIASSMTDRRRVAIEDGLGRGHDLEIVETVSRDHAREIAAAAAARGVDVVVVAAGDGTLNEAADGLIGTTTALAPLPGGSTNVFARAVGFGNRLDRAIDRLLDALDRHAIRRVGVGAANDRHFLFHLGAGFDAAVVERIERRPQVKRYAAHAAFALETLRLLARGFDRREPAIRVESGNRRSAHVSFFTVVSNIAPYTYVGARRMLLTDAAGLDRSLAVTSLTRFGIRDVAVAAGSAVAQARRLQHAPHVVQLHDVDELRLTTTRAGHGFPWQVDGDYLGTVERLDVRYVPSALSLVLPQEI